MGIKNIIFDFGNVLAKYDPDYILDGFTADIKTKMLLKDVLFSIWPALDDCSYSFNEFKEITLKKLPKNLHETAKRFYDEWYKRMPENQDIVPLIPVLKDNGYKLFILSNATDSFAETINYFKFTKYFDGIVISGKEKVAKPNIKLYMTLLERYSLIPEECIFFDDIQQNIDGAQKCGINAVLFTGDTSELKKLISNSDLHI